MCPYIVRRISYHLAKSAVYNLFEKSKIKLKFDPNLSFDHELTRICRNIINCKCYPHECAWAFYKFQCITTFEIFDNLNNPCSGRPNEKVGFFPCNFGGHSGYANPLQAALELMGFEYRYLVKIFRGVNFRLCTNISFQSWCLFEKCEDGFFRVTDFDIENECGDECYCV